MKDGSRHFDYGTLKANCKISEIQEEEKYIADILSTNSVSLKLYKVYQYKIHPRLYGQGCPVNGKCVDVRVEQSPARLLAVEK